MCVHTHIPPVMHFVHTQPILHRLQESHRDSCLILQVVLYVLSFHCITEGNSLFREWHSSVFHFCFHNECTLSLLLAATSHSSHVVRVVAPVDIARAYCSIVLQAISSIPLLSCWGISASTHPARSLANRYLVMQSLYYSIKTKVCTSVGMAVVTIVTCIQTTMAMQDPNSV